MLKAIQNWIRQIVPDAYWNIITLKDMEQFLTEDIDDISIFESRVALTPKEKRWKKEAIGKGKR